MDTNRLILISAFAIIAVWAFSSQMTASVANQNAIVQPVFGPIGPRTPTQWGNHAQDFMLPDYLGTPHKLSEHAGKVVVVGFWTTDCVECVDELPVYEKMYKLYKDQGLEIIIINRGQAADEAAIFTSALNLTYLVLLDANDTVAKSYGLDVTPSSVLIGTDGVIQQVRYGSHYQKELGYTLRAILAKEPLPHDVPNGLPFLDALPPSELPSDRIKDPLSW
ncbi:MAG: alkyl hydroperoxide reductase/thiol specific antioxidant/Mal allergen [Gammaproteobacteria bacterium]|nr:MAG: alkyl hydroperoxide reductase/thiol specific antioxidant/Mal allergen [Gammaproteobacteria bacterium]TND02197.1 MAG: alkyl hydroperoxide reductase/thiol specific antioxidant/Mal allergen [Gammaproteobacteria bacterium]